MIHPSSYNAKFGAEALAKVGGGVTVNKVGRTSTGAQYWDGSAWAVWKGCGSK